MGRYPDMQTALPTTFVNPTRTARILNPSFVLGTVTALGILSVAGLIFAGKVLSTGVERVQSVNTLQSLGLFSSLLSFLYLFLHGLAARKNEPVGVVRPPVVRVHAACFVVARLVFITWFSAFVAACVVVSKPLTCVRGTANCNMQVGDLIISICAMITIGITLTIFESCKYPFQMPEFLHVARRMAKRRSTGEDPLLERSVSRTSSFEQLRRASPKDSSPKSSIDIKPLPKPPADMSERPITPLLPMARRSSSRSRGWGEKWIHPVERKRLERKGLERKVSGNSDSAMPLTYDSSEGYVGSSERSSSQFSHKSGSRRRSTGVAKRGRRPHTITPSSSISNFSRRSPLSTVRSAEHPEVLMRPDLRYSPPAIPPSIDWTHSRSVSISHLSPIADVKYLQRRASMDYLQRRNSTEQFSVRRPNKTLPTVPGSPSGSRRGCRENNPASAYTTVEL